MNRTPDQNTLGAVLASATRRVLLIDAARGAGGGVAVALAGVLAGVPPRGLTAWAIGSALLAAGGGALMFVWFARDRRQRIAYEIEARAPHARNIIITAAELLRSEGTANDEGRRATADDAANDAARSTASTGFTLGVRPDVGALVVREAARVAGGLDISALFPIRHALLLLALSTTLFSVAIARDTLPLRSASAVLRRSVSPGTASIEEVIITVAAPSYALQPVETLRNVPRIDALVGSRIHLQVRAGADSLTVQTMRGSRTIAATSPESFAVDLRAEDDGFIILIPRTADGREGAHRLIGLSVRADRPPQVRIAAPGRDLMLKDPRHTIELGVNADDDIGLASLRVRYTKVSGSGERFTFSDGEVPLTVSRGSSRQWNARGAFRLDTLGLNAGDMVVYRAVATDRRPGAPAQESDAFIAEIVAPGGEAAAGFAIDPDQERYAVSQQMVILRTEALIARRASMAADSVTAASRDIAAEQRKVRAEFVFMMGGEMADAPDPDASMNDLNEEAEAEAEGDLAAGRLANQGRMALTRAIRFMSRATTTLTNVELADALKAEKSALTQLEQAFSRTRILLRALSERERLDPTRRLSGSLTDAQSDRRAAAAPRSDPQADVLRRALAALSTLTDPVTRARAPQVGSESGGERSLVGASAGDRMTALAEAVLRVDPASLPLQRIATQLTAAATAAVRARGAEVRTLLDSASLGLTAVLQVNAPTAAPTSMRAGRLAGALVDALSGTRRR